VFLVQVDVDDLVDDVDDEGCKDFHQRVKYSNTSHQIKEIDESYLSIISEEYDNGLIKGERPRAVDVDSGFSHSAALDSTGSLWVWGKFLSTTLSSDGTSYADQFVPRKIRGIDDRIVLYNLHADNFIQLH